MGMAVVAIRKIVTNGWDNLPSSGAGGKAANSRASFFTRASSRKPPQQVSSVFHKTRRSCEADQKGLMQRDGHHLLDWVAFSTFVSQTRDQVE